jgi:AraC family transcriptional regulator
MSAPDADTTPILLPVVQFAPWHIARRHITARNGIRTDTVEVVRREPFQAGFKAPCHLLIMCERAERDDGETLVEGLPRSTLQEFSRTLSFVPASHLFFSWHKPRKLPRVTHFYIDPRGPLIDPELRFAESEFTPRLFFFDHDLWETALKLKAQALNPGPGQKQYAEALSIVLMHELLRLNSSVPLADIALLQTFLARTNRIGDTLRISNRGHRVCGRRLGEE